MKLIFKCSPNLGRVADNILNQCGEQALVDFVTYMNNRKEIFINIIKPLLIKEPIKAIMVIQQMMDMVIKKEKPDNIQCNNCKIANCCYLNLDIIMSERLVIMEYIKKLGHTLPSFLGKNEWERLNIQADYIKKIPKNKIISDEFAKLPVEYRKCIFLNNDDKCSIYQIRPLRCRAFYVMNYTIKCDKNNPFLNLPFWYSTEAEIMIDALSSFKKNYQFSAIMRDLHER